MLIVKSLPRSARCRVVVNSLLSLAGVGGAEALHWGEVRSTVGDGTNLKPRNQHDFTSKSVHRDVGLPGA